MTGGVAIIGGGILGTLLAREFDQILPKTGKDEPQIVIADLPDDDVDFDAEQVATRHTQGVIHRGSAYLRIPKDKEIDSFTPSELVPLFVEAGDFWSNMAQQSPSFRSKTIVGFRAKNIARTHRRVFDNANKIKAVDAQVPSFLKEMTAAYESREFTLDVPAFIQQVRSNFSQRVKRISSSVELLGSTLDPVVKLDCGKKCKAGLVVLAAGTGNYELLRQLGTEFESPAQLISILCVLVPAKIAIDHTIVLPDGSRSAILVSLKADDDSSFLLFQPTGKGSSEAETIAEFRSLFPTFWTSSCQHGFCQLPFEVGPDEAERRNGGSIVQKDNVIAAWPARLTLAPLLAKHLALVPVNPGPVEFPQERFDSGAPQICQPFWNVIRSRFKRCDQN